ncbi:MAG: hypothetical protein ACRD8W_25765 [Nitrososphaeraceae archaeon]
MDKNNKQGFDWREVITKPVHISDNKHVGHVDGLSDTEFIIKDKIIHARYYSVPRDQLERFEHRLVNSRSRSNGFKFRRDRPGYFTKV